MGLVKPTWTAFSQLRSRRADQMWHPSQVVQKDIIHVSSDDVVVMVGIQSPQSVHVLFQQDERGQSYPAVLPPFGGIHTGILLLEIFYHALQDDLGVAGIVRATGVGGPEVVTVNVHLGGTHLGRVVIVE